MKKRPVNLEKSDANIAEQYPDIFDGLQKDAAQNAWDARATKNGRDWKLIFKYLHERNILVIEDFGTTGMNEDKWIKYQSLWDTSKMDEDALGARGQGKFLFHYFSRTKLVLTETIDEKKVYRFSFGTSEEWDDEGKKLQDFIPGAAPLAHQGTRIWIMDLKSEFRDELLDTKIFMRYISSTWWEIIRDYNAVFIVNFDGVDRQVIPVTQPKPLKERRYEREKINDIGKIRTLVFRFFRDDVPEEFRGIAIQRGGMTILRLPIIAEESVKRKVCGYCNFDSQLDMELKKCEQPTHFGFFNKKQWNHVREYIRKKAEEFVQEISPKRERVHVAADILEEAVKLVNDLVSEYAPELLSGPAAPDGKGRERGGPVKPREKLPVRIDIFRPNQHKFEYNESLKIECEIVNDMNAGRDVIFKLVVVDKDGNEKHVSRYSLIISPYSRKTVDIQLIDFDEEIDKPGKYTGKGRLIESRSEIPIQEKTFTFYLHEEPPRIGKGFISKIEFVLGKRPDGVLQQFAKWKNLPLTDEGILRIVYDHQEFIRLRELPETKKDIKREMLLYITRCSIDEAMEKLLELGYRDDNLDFDKIRDIKNSCDEMLYEASVRTI